MIRILFGLEDRLCLGLGETPLPLDVSRFSVWELAELESVGMDLQTIGRGLQERKASALLAIGWVAARRVGKAGRIMDFDFYPDEMSVTDDTPVGDGLGKDPVEVGSPTYSTGTD